jgi:hypothetical protein
MGGSLNNFGISGTQSMFTQQMIDANIAQIQREQ